MRLPYLHSTEITLKFKRPARRPGHGPYKCHQHQDLEGRVRREFLGRLSEAGSSWRLTLTHESGGTASPPAPFLG